MEKQSIKQYFQFSRRERNGIFLLFFVLIVLIILRFTIPLWGSLDKEEAKKQFAQNALELKELNNRVEGGQQIRLQPFDPNSYTYDSLLLCGLPSKLASQIINYREKVGPFKSKTDFAKLYNLTDSLYNVLDTFILLPQEEEIIKPEKRKVEINDADSFQLLSVKGIGPAYASKILQYRRLLGGYYTLDQLGEAFYINANTLAEQQKRMEEIKKQLTVNPSRIMKLNINTATHHQLISHPYISYKESKAIERLRKKTGKINGMNDLTGASILTQDKIMLLHHYIDF